MAVSAMRVESSSRCVAASTALRSASRLATSAGAARAESRECRTAVSRARMSASMAGRGSSRN
eukprot:5241940-Pleurochrysis_carterae.AAC.1